jgi:hypothetical protein
MQSTNSRTINLAHVPPSERERLSKLIEELKKRKNRDDTKRLSVFCADSMA